MTRPPRWIVPVLLGALSLLLGWYHVGRLSFWDDEAYSYYSAHLTWSGLWNLSLFTDPHTTLWHVLSKVWYGIHDGREAWARFPSVVAGALTVVTVWALSRRLFNERIALTSALFLSLSAAMTSYQTEARPYTLAIFFTALSVWRLAVTVREPTSTNVLAYGGVSALALYAHPFTAFVIVSLALVFVLVTRRPFSFYLPALLMFLFVAMPQIALVATNVGNDNLDWIPSFSLSLVADSVSLLTGNKNPFIFGTELLILTAGIVSLVRRRPTERWPYVLVAAWLVGAPALGLAVDVAKPVIVPRYLLPALPAFSIALAVAIDAIGARVRPVLTVGVTALLVAGLMVNGRTHYRVDNDWRSAVNVVNINAQPGDRVMTFHHEPVFRYYSDVTQSPSLGYVVRANRVHETDMLKQANDFRPDTNSLRELASSPGRVWVVRLKGSLDDPSQPDYLPPNLAYTTTDFGTFHDVVVQLLSPK